MDQSKLKPPIGAKHRRKRVGRGDGSGHGTYSGRGCKGQKSRSGGGVRLGFEGGQLPLIKRLPRKRGFVNIFRIEYNVVNVGKLKVFAPNTEVTPQELLKARLVKSLKRPVKVLGDGEIDRPLVVRVDKFSAAAERKIVAVGGRVEAI
ncbi:MAG: 50S ribosomal protein L15 [Dehalococcoidia bacterium]|nr:MAG: 50S ribosomal protein L15 [Dehalococcoidia bacterium]